MSSSGAWHRSIPLHLTSLKDIESLKQILEYSQNPYLRPDRHLTMYHLVRPYSAKFQKTTHTYPTS